METEIWKDIPWYEWLYRISSIGNKVESYGTIKKWRIMKLHVSKWYIRLKLVKNWIHKLHLLHRLKAITFIDNPFNLPQVNHIDWIKDNNELDNLEWCTISHNIKHAFRMGLMKNNSFFTKHPFKGKFWKDNPSAKPVLQYSKSWDLIKEWWSMVDAEICLCINGIRQVCSKPNRTCWWYVWKFSNSPELRQCLSQSGTTWQWGECVIILNN